MAIKYLDTKENFKKYLTNKTTLMPSSIITYSKLINEYIDRYGIEPNVNSLDDFITIKCKNRQPSVKYAIKHFLNFRWKHKKMYYELRQAKIMPTIRKKRFVNEEQAMNIMLENGPYLFIKSPIEIEEFKLRTKVETYYKRYYESLKQSVSDLGFSIATHDWRRSFAESLKKKGIDIYDIKVALRHSSIKTTERYFENDPEKVATTMLKHQHAI